MRGPWTQPPSIASCKATSSKSEEPTLRTVVKPAFERLGGVGDSDRGPEIVGELQPLIAADLGQAGQVDVHVDEAGEQGLARQVDMLDLVGELHRTRVGERRDPAVIVDEDRGMLDIAAGGDVEHPVGGDDGGRRDRRGETRCRGCGQQDALHASASPPDQMWITRPNAASTLSCIISDKVGCGKTVWMKSSSTSSAVLPMV